MVSWVGEDQDVSSSGNSTAKGGGCSQESREKAKGRRRLLGVQRSPCEKGGLPMNLTAGVPPFSNASSRQECKEVC